VTRRRSARGAAREVAVPIARCPFTGDLAVLAVDTAGLDSPWWDYVAPLRNVEAEDELPPTWFGVAGALLLADAVEATEHLVMAGPEAPFVLPDLLGDKRVKAVLSQVPVGAHTGYAISYFATLPLPRDLARPNTWGTDRCWYAGTGGTAVWSQLDDDDLGRDFELGPWIDRGDLQWIAPGDQTAELRSGRVDCPYLDLPGRRAPVYANYGQTWIATVSSGY
jgi:hypothetical protein